MGKAINIFMTDTETAGEIMKALVYDFGGGKTTLRNGGLSDTMNYINYNVFYEKQDMMASAYYANKLPAYRDEIWEGKREVFDIMEIRERVHKKIILLSFAPIMPALISAHLTIQSAKQLMAKLSIFSPMA